MENKTRPMPVTTGPIDMRDRNKPHVRLKENGGVRYEKRSAA